MIDETYVEFAPDIAEITAISLTDEFDNVMVIRGVSKFYAAPGLRFGYGITSNHEFLEALLIHQNPWILNASQPRPVSACSKTTPTNKQQDSLSAPNATACTWLYKTCRLSKHTSLMPTSYLYAS